MALITCSECSNSISDKAVACPQCGCPLKEFVGGTSSHGSNIKYVPELNKDSNTHISLERTDSNNVESGGLSGCLLVLGGIVIIGAVIVSMFGLPHFGISIIAIAAIGRLLTYFGKK